jgi:glucose-6-phosphate isomerase
MLQIDFKNSLVSDKQIQNNGNKISKYIDRVNLVAKAMDYSHEESSINCPFDSSAIKSVKDLAKRKVYKDLKYIILIGIGGSNLGAKAVYDAFFGLSDALEPNRFPKMIFIDTVNSSALAQLKNKAKHLNSKNEFLIVEISKSGSTMETSANFEMVFSIFKSKFDDILDRVVVISDFGSKLYNLAKSRDIAVLDVPKKVGGRYSIFSSTGLFPLSACGFKIDDLLNGAKKMRSACLNKNILNNPAARSASVIFENYKKGKNIHDTFVFKPELESLAKWHRQLLGESTGKEKDLNNKIVRVGIIPTVSVGTSDLHSVGQLYIGGPKNRFTSFISVSEINKNYCVPKNGFFYEFSQIVSKKSADEILFSILRGVQNTYAKKHLSFIDMVLPKLSLEYIGQFMQFKMLEIMYLAKLLNINAFDQPAVEDYKKEVREILNRK